MRHRHVYPSQVRGEGRPRAMYATSQITKLRGEMGSLSRIAVDHEPSEPPRRRRRRIGERIWGGFIPTSLGMTWYALPPARP